MELEELIETIKNYVEEEPKTEESKRIREAVVRLDRKSHNFLALLGEKLEKEGKKELKDKIQELGRTLLGVKISYIWGVFQEIAEDLKEKKVDERQAIGILMRMEELLEKEVLSYVFRLTNEVEKKSLQASRDLYFLLYHASRMRREKSLEIESGKRLAAVLKQTGENEDALEVLEQLISAIDMGLYFEHRKAKEDILEMLQMMKEINQILGKDKELAKLEKWIKDVQEDIEIDKKSEDIDKNKQ